MIKVTIYYSNGVHETVEFDSVEDMNWFIHMEGDHVVDYEVMIDE